MARHAACFTDDVDPALADEQRPDPALGRPRRRTSATGCATYFRDQIFPVLTPLAVDPAHPFPYISGLSLNLAVVVRDPDGGPELFARVKVPNNVPRFVSVDAPGRTPMADGGGRRARFLPVEELIAAHLASSSPACRSSSTTCSGSPATPSSRSTTTATRTCCRRWSGSWPGAGSGRRCGSRWPRPSPTTCWTCSSASWTWTTSDVLRVPGLLDLSALWQVYEEVDRPDLKDRPFVPATHPAASPRARPPRSVFARLREGDMLVHHPYHSFSTSVQRFIEQAAADPNVLAIKQTLYRTSGDSPVVDALIDAAEAGKQVVVLVEVKARFDEQANIGWARTLEQAGCHVVYGLVGLKTHCKTAMVVRQEGSQIRRYCHIGTGNYHPKTARIYEDFGLLTADPEVGADLTDLFNVLTGYSRQTAYRRLLVAPHGVRAGIIERIEREIEHARSGRPALVQIKVNSLVDEEIDRRALPGQPGRRRGRPARPRHLHAAAGGARAVRQHPGPLDPRPVPGALAGLRFGNGRRRRSSGSARPT